MDSRREGMMVLELTTGYASENRNRNGSERTNIDLSDILSNRTDNMGGNRNPNSPPTTDEVREGVVNALNPAITQAQQVLSNATAIQASIDQKIRKLNEFLVNAGGNQKVEPLPSDIFTEDNRSSQNANSTQLQDLTLEMKALIANGKWNAAKEKALKELEKPSAEDKRNSTVEILSKMAQENGGDVSSFFNQATSFEKAVIVGLGATAAVVALPEAVLSAGGYLLTALTIGPVAEGITLEVLANPAFMQAATRAGAIIGGGKALNIFRMFEPVRSEVSIAEKHPLTGLSVEQVIQKVKSLGLETPKDSYILYSGLGEGRQGIKLSQEFAEKNGYITLEMTKGGKWLDNMDLFGVNSPFTRQETRYIWKEVSILAMKAASGRVQAVTGAIIPDSIYYKELQVMATNEKITGFEELTIKPKILIMR